MLAIKEESHLMKVKEKLEQMDDLLTDLRIDYLEMAQKYDEALQQIDDLEAEALFMREESYEL